MILRFFEFFEIFMENDTRQIHPVQQNRWWGDSPARKASWIQRGPRWQLRPASKSSLVINFQRQWNQRFFKTGRS